MTNAGKTVLVAEDEILIRLMAVDFLADAGFSVLTAEHAEEALALLNTQSLDVHVLFTDIHMPGALNGLALAHHTHRHFPWIAVLVVSGDAKPAVHELPEGSCFISKPYDPEHVVASMSEVIAVKAARESAAAARSDGTLRP